jgi:hypothetical protein
MGAHALGAAAYAAKAAGLATPERPGAVEDEVRWQLDCMSAGQRRPPTTANRRSELVRPARTRATRVRAPRHDHP